MNIEKQAQGRIKRLMLEQQLAVPYGIGGVVDNHSESLLNRMSEKMLRDIDSKMLETNPIIKINCEDDKIKIQPLSPDKVYLQSGMVSAAMREDVWNWPKLNDALEEEELELTLTNGVFE